MQLLVTGGAGFIGSNLVLQWLERNPADKILNVDKLTYAANPQYLEAVAKHPGYRLAQIDITDRAALGATIREFKPEGVIHLAAESHVDNSISGPEAFVRTNVLGTFNLLEECRQFWSGGVTGSEGQRKLAPYRFLHVSTDEVYGTLGETGSFTETTPYSPNSPYSASKAGSDHLVNAYFHTYKLNAVTTQCSNNYGPHQHREKLIPTVIRSALSGQKIPVYGQGTNVRDWLFVRDHCSALELVFKKGRAGERYNIGGRNEIMNIELVRKICAILNQEVGKGPGGDYQNLISFVTDRPGHDFRYSIDCSKLESELGWRPTPDFESMIRETVRWYIGHLRLNA